MEKTIQNHREWEVIVILNQAVLAALLGVWVQASILVLLENFYFSTLPIITLRL